MSASEVRLVRRRQFSARNADDVRDIIALLANERHHGPVTINMAHGGVRGVLAEDSAALPEAITVGNNWSGEAREAVST